jgi:rubredoxin
LQTTENNILNKSKDKSKREVIRMAHKYQCTICGYIYDPEKGDPDSGVAPNTPFEALPDGWTCPQCGSAKDSFKELA